MSLTSQGNKAEASLETDGGGLCIQVFRRGYSNSANDEHSKWLDGSFHSKRTGYSISMPGHSTETIDPWARRIKPARQRGSLDLNNARRIRTPYRERH